MNIRSLDTDDAGYALFSWREGHKKSPSHERMPWSYYKDTLGHAFQKILDDPTTKMLGAYDPSGLRGWIAVTPGKRVSTVHWVHVKHTLEDGTRGRRQGVMMALLDAAELGPQFVYTLRGRRLERDARPMKSLDEAIVAALRAKGVTATYVALKDWLK